MKWTEGLSKTSIGRFGGYGRDYVLDERGFLCWNATPDKISIELPSGGKQVMGQFKLSSPFLAETEADWVTVRHTLKTKKSGRLYTAAVVYQSLLSPGILFDIKVDNFIWQYDRSYQMMKNFYLTDKGYIVKSSSCDYSRVEDGNWKVPWMIAYNNSAGQPDMPLLFIFQKKPVSITSINNDYKKFNFSGNAGKVMVMPLLGIDAVPGEDGKKWGVRDIKKLAGVCDFWARAMLAYPVQCREYYSVNDKYNNLSLKNIFEYVTCRSEWGLKPLYLAPVPPVAVQAGDYGYPVKFREKIFDCGIPTRCGYFRAAYSKSLNYEIPCFSHVKDNIMPVRVVNDAGFENLTKKLESYLEKPTLTFGGDETYDDSNIQDVLHNFRILGWAAWSLDGKKRENILARLSRGLGGLDLKNYDRQIEPLNKRSFLKEKQIWVDINSRVSFDYEWYNGMQLAGLWSYLYFGGSRNAKKSINKRWNIIEGLTDYFRIYNDWATMTFLTDTTGEHLWMDGFHYGWQGLIGLARMARVIGKKSTCDEAQYLVAKSTLARWCTWRLAEYADKHRQSVPYNRVKDIKDITAEYIIGGFIARKGLTLARFYDQGNVISYCVPELFLLYMDYPEILEKLKTGQYKQLPKYYAAWNKNVNKKPEKIWKWNPIDQKKLKEKDFYGQVMAWHHFYFLDPHLFVRSLVLREPWKKLKSYTGHLSGPVMESYLVGTHPMVIFPVNIGFRGNVWDEKTKILTIKWESDAEKDAEIKIVTEKKPLGIIGLNKWVYDRKNKSVTGSFTAKGKGIIQVKFIFCQNGSFKER